MSGAYQTDRAARRFNLCRTPGLGRYDQPVTGGNQLRRFRPVSIIRFIASVHEATDGRSLSMAWTKPEFTIVSVTLEVTAYAGKK